MGVAVTPDFEIVFDTKRSTRKYLNLINNPRVALVIGCGGPVSIQYEGTVEELNGGVLDRYLEVYFAVFPDGRDRQTWPGMTYFVVRPKWVRYCNYTQRPPEIREYHLLNT